MTWDALSSGTNILLNSIYFTDDNTGYVIGENGIILKTTNGGGYPVGMIDLRSNKHL